MIRFRPHHFLCAFCYQGKGYSGSFIRNFSKIMATLKTPQGDNEELQIVRHTDDICAPCPHRCELACTSEDKVQRLDNAHSEALGLATVENISWGKIKQLISSRLTIEKFHKICDGCEWKASGICESVLRNSGIN